MRPGVVYISYDGVQEPLGQSQVLPYLERLAVDFKISLISFEKPDAADATVARRLNDAGIRWLPLRYHKRPPVLSTVRDMLAGARALRRELSRRDIRVVHVRSYVPGAIALAGRLRGARLLFDIRGFWVDERVEGGLWRRGGVLYRLGKRVEKRLFARADAVVTLTEASVPQIRRWLGPRDVPIVVIPTCAEVDRFADASAPRTEACTVWAGSLTTWYRFDLATRLAAAIDRPFLVLTRETDAARVAAPTATVRSVRPEAMPDNLRPGDIGLCLIRTSFSKQASAPTRLAEYLAAGMPVAVTPGVGGIEELVESEDVGVVIRDESPEGLVAAAERLEELASDPAVCARCTRIARERFSVDAGVDRYSALYRRLS